MHNKQEDKNKNMYNFMESDIMINEFISEDYKNAETFTTDIGIVKKSISFNEDGDQHEQTYIDIGGNFMIVIEIVEEKPASIFNRHPIYNTFVWYGTKEALTVDYKLLVDAINKSAGEKKEQLQALLEKLSNDQTFIAGVIDKKPYNFLYGYNKQVYK